MNTIGITHTLDGFAIESARKKKIPQRETILDSNGKVMMEARRDTRAELALVVRGATEPSDSQIVFADETFIVDSVEEIESFDGLRRFNITAHHYELCNTETIP